MYFLRANAKRHMQFYKLFWFATVRKRTNIMIVVHVKNDC